MNQVHINMNRIHINIYFILILHLIHFEDNKNPIHLQRISVEMLDYISNQIRFKHLNNILKW
jgi:hypothetical protein